MISFSAVGDCFITRNIIKGDQQVRKIANLLQKVDFRLANLEVCLNEGEVFASHISGGTWASAHPSVIYTLKEFGFNLISWANNHTLDYLHNGLIITKKHLDESGLVHAGAGLNLSEASSPKYLENTKHRISLISCVTTAPSDWIASDQRVDTIGRPGVNLIRTESINMVTNSDLVYIHKLSEDLGINYGLEASVEQGFRPELRPDVISFGDYKFKEHNKREVRIVVNEVDLKRIKKKIKLAKANSDYVIVSLHAHEMEGKNNNEPAQFLIDFAHKLIDFGAKSVVCHGPHVIRGIEIYCGCPIFYSLGNFIYQPESVIDQPADAYEKFDLNNNHDVSDLNYTMNAKNSRGHYVIKEMWESIIPIWYMDKGKLTKISLHPLDLGYGLPNYRMGWPSLTNDVQVLERIKILSEKFGTSMTIENGVGNIVFN